MAPLPMDMANMIPPFIADLPMSDDGMNHQQYAFDIGTFAVPGDALFGGAFTDDPECGFGGAHSSSFQASSFSPGTGPLSSSDIQELQQQQQQQHLRHHDSKSGSGPLQSQVQHQQSVYAHDHIPYYIKQENNPQTEQSYLNAASVTHDSAMTSPNPQKPCTFPRPHQHNEQTEESAATAMAAYQAQTMQYISQSILQQQMHQQQTQGRQQHVEVFMDSFPGLIEIRPVNTNTDTTQNYRHDPQQFPQYHFHEHHYQQQLLHQQVSSPKEGSWSPMSDQSQFDSMTDDEPLAATRYSSHTSLSSVSSWNDDQVVSPLSNLTMSTETPTCEPLVLFPPSAAIRILSSPLKQHQSSFDSDSEGPEEEDEALVPGKRRKRVRRPLAKKAVSKPSPKIKLPVVASNVRVNLVCNDMQRRTDGVGCIRLCDARLMRVYSIMGSETEVECTVRFYPKRPHGKKTVVVDLEAFQRQTF
ncbi:hypothetical protein BG004_006196 [Podila humilis]|nr:hypothetical protein BG004_006196 [Podila humilis]